MAVPPNVWFIMENHGTSIYKWMIWEYPYFRKPPYVCIYIYAHGGFLK